MTIPKTADPMCGWCNRPELRDIDPATTAFLCTPHQEIADRLHKDIEHMLVPRDKLALPAGYEAWPTGIITTAPPPDPAPFDIDAMLEWIRLWTRGPKTADTDLEAQICMELQMAIVPVSPIELAIRIATIARHYFTNRKISSTHTSWRVCWLERFGRVLGTRECARPHEAEELGARRVGTDGIAGYRVDRQDHEAYEDGSHFTGPWITVTSTLEPTSEEPPCTATRES